MNEPNGSDTLSNDVDTEPTHTLPFLQPSDSLESLLRDQPLTSPYIDLSQTVACNFWPGGASTDGVISENAFDDFIIHDLGETHVDSTALADLSLDFDHSPKSVDLGFIFSGTPYHHISGEHGTALSDALSRPGHSLSADFVEGDKGASFAPRSLLPATDANHENSSAFPQSSFAPDSIHPLERSVSAPNSDNAGYLNASLQRPLENTPEIINTLFDLHICKRISIKGDGPHSPWMTIVWPLSQTYPALYDALAAMVFFHLSREDPSRRVQAIQHYQRSTQSLTGPADGNFMPLKAALATRLALGFAEAWDPETPSSGQLHIQAATPLVQQAVSQHQISYLNPDEHEWLKFFVNTWMYMDVMARFGRSSTLIPTDEDLMSVCSQLSEDCADHNLDPLLGCASTLFPMLSRLADLVGLALKSNKSNSIDYISRATNLRVEIERWSPTIDIEGNDEDKSCIADSIQTAEAYRWAALLLLRQTVPEVPWAHSQFELAQKTLVYLATVPRDSPTTFLQVFPLIVASVEVFELESREWIRRKWDHMSQVLNMIVAERCRKLTEEVWQRRDDFEDQHGIRPVPKAQGEALDSNDCHPRLDQLSMSISKASPKSRVNTRLKLHSMTNNFPDSMAFKKGIDPITRAGYTEYTVRGNLGFLAVMKDWNWERKSIYMLARVIILVVNALMLKNSHAWLTLLRTTRTGLSQFYPDWNHKH